MIARTRVWAQFEGDYTFYENACNHLSIVKTELSLSIILARILIGRLILWKINDFE